MEKKDILYIKFALAEILKSLSDVEQLPSTSEIVRSIEEDVLTFIRETYDEELNNGKKFVCRRCGFSQYTQEKSPGSRVTCLHCGAYYFPGGVRYEEI